MNATVSSIHVNGWYGGHNKLAGARWVVRELLGRELEDELDRWVYVGDSTNDVLMFERFPHSVACQHPALRGPARVQAATSPTANAARASPSGAGRPRGPLGHDRLQRPLLHARAAARFFQQARIDAFMMRP